MAKATLFVCAKCSHKTFERSNITKHTNRGRPCSSSRVEKVDVVFSVPSLGHLLRNEKTLEQHMHQTQVLVESASFGKHFYETYGEETYKSLFMIDDPIKRAARLFDLTLSRYSGKPEFWNWVEPGNGRVAVYESAETLSTRRVREYHAQKDLGDLTYRLYTLFELAFRTDIVPGTEWFNNDQFWNTFDGTPTPMRNALMCFEYQRDVTGYRPWMESLRTRIRKNLPKQREVIPMQRAYTAVADDATSNPNVLTAWVCRGCGLPSASKASVKSHASKCPTVHDAFDYFPIGVRVKYNLASIDAEERFGATT